MYKDKFHLYDRFYDASIQCLADPEYIPLSIGN